ncbi:MAG: ribosomal protein [Frankiales bacterium]|nr:ribosomal protein [Frankiales bacterium]
MTSVVEHKRATVRPDKGDTVAELTESFSSSAAAVLTEYRGLTVKQITDLRVALGADTTYSVVKNTLTKIAAQNAGLQGLDVLLAGPTAVAFVSGDPVSAAKALRDFAKANPALVVKGGVMDGKALTADEIKKLADLESREVLLSKMAGALKASLSNAVSLFAAPLSQAARALGALEAKAMADPSVLEGGAGTPAPAQDTTEAPAADDTTEAPAAEDTTEAPAAEDTTEAPAAEQTPEAPAAEDTTEAPAAEASTETSTESE